MLGHGGSHRACGGSDEDNPSGQRWSDAAESRTAGRGGTVWNSGSAVSGEIYFGLGRAPGGDFQTRPVSHGSLHQSETGFPALLDELRTYLGAEKPGQVVKALEEYVTSRWDRAASAHNWWKTRGSVCTSRRTLLLNLCTLPRKGY